MRAFNAISDLARSGYKVQFQSAFIDSIKVTLSKGSIFCSRGIDPIFDLSDEDFCIMLEYMKEEVDRMDADYRKEKHDGCN